MTKTQNSNGLNKILFISLLPVSPEEVRDLGFIFLKNNFIYLCLTLLGLHWCVGLSLVVKGWGFSLVVV